MLKDPMADEFDKAISSYVLTALYGRCRHSDSGHIHDVTYDHIRKVVSVRSASFFDCAFRMARKFFVGAWGIVAQREGDAALLGSQVWLGAG